jgi:sugar phosphate isomerase/epimerase
MLLGRKSHGFRRRAQRCTAAWDSLEEMQHGISTHIFLQQRLTPALLDALVRGGAGSIEIFAARHHFAYTDRNAVRELANWFRANDVAAMLHMPIFASDDETNWSRYTAPTLNLIDTNKGARIEAMDEVKRALEAAEQIPLRSCVLHLGMKDDRWDTRSLDDSLTSLEHLQAFAAPLGVKLLLENLTNDVAAPAHLVEIVRAGHFDTIGFCLDVGHAHLAEPMPAARDHAAKSGVALAFEAFGDRLAELHLHDNHGARDQHLWPGEGTVDWAEVGKQIAALKVQPTGVLEIAHEPVETPARVVAKASPAWELLDGRIEG